MKFYKTLLIYSQNIAKFIHKLRYDSKMNLSFLIKVSNDA